MNEVAMDPAGVAAVADRLHRGAADLDGAAAGAADPPDAGASTAAIAGLTAALSGAVGVYVEAMTAAGALVTAGLTDLQRADTESAHGLGGSAP